MKDEIMRLADEYAQEVKDFGYLDESPTRAALEAAVLAQCEPVGINGLTEAETAATASVMGLVAPEAKQEPVAWMCSNNELMHKGYQRFASTPGGDWNIPVYTHPAPVNQEPVHDEYEEGYQAASRYFRDRIEQYRLEAQSYKEAYFKLLERIANFKAVEPPAPIILTHPAPVNQALLESLKIAVDTNLGEAWVWPVSAKETWLKNARAAIAAAGGEKK